MRIQERLEASQREFDELTEKIDRQGPGEIRKRLKHRRATLSGEMVTLRQAMINEQMRTEHPQEVSRVRFVEQIGLRKNKSAEAE